MSLTSPSKESGFTLLEVLIAICILAFISMGIYQAVTETYRIRETLSTEGDFYNGIRLAMNIMQRDVTLVYSPLAFAPAPSPGPSNIPGQSQVQNPSLPQLPQIPPQVLAADPTMAQVTTFWEPAMTTNNIRLSRFIGTENSLSFISNSHMRVYKDSAESEFAKITYKLEDDDQNKDEKMLVKVEDTDAFNVQQSLDQNPFERSYTLLHGIKSFKYRFYRKDKDEWGPEWDTDKDEFKYLYPDIVELTIEVLGPKRLSFDGRFLFRPELPLRALNPSM